MKSIVRVGTVLIGEEAPRMAEVLALESEPYFNNWSVVSSLDSRSLDDKIRLARWNFFFLAGEIKARFFGQPTEGRVREALQKIANEVGKQDFNCLEVTGILAQRFFGLPCTVVYAHARHIQRSCLLDSVESRSNGRRDADWARG